MRATLKFIDRSMRPGGMGGVSEGLEDGDSGTYNGLVTEVAQKREWGCWPAQWIEKSYKEMVMMGVKSQARKQRLDMGKLEVSLHSIISYPFYYLWLDFTNE